MTMRITLGIDPGQTGAVAVLADADVDTIIDMPVIARTTTGNEINGAELAASLRGVMQRHPGAHMFAVLERVHSMPGMGSGSVFNFGESYGKVKGVLETLGIGYRYAEPKTWKRFYGIHRSKEERDQMGGAAYKDLSRACAVQRYPACAPHLTRKKDVGRADAILIGKWGYETEQAARRA